MGKPHDRAPGSQALQSEHVATLIRRGIVAGLFPGAVAAWGRAGQPPVQTAEGASRLVPFVERTLTRTLYDLASLTKPLVVVPLFLMAMREGRVRLGSRASTVIPELAGSPAGHLAMGDLLTHSSGLPAWRPLYAETRGDPSRLFDAFNVLARSAAGRHDHPVVYSCLGYILLGSILERIFDQPLDGLFAERIAIPLGLEKEAGFHPGSGPLAAGAMAPDAEIDLLRQMSRDQEIDFIPPLDDHLPDDGNARFLGGVAGNAGLFATARAVFVLTSQFIEGASQLFSPREIRLTLRDHTPRSAQQGRGLGWQLARSLGCSAGTALPRSSFGHTGFTGTSVWADPRRGLVAVLLANRHHPRHRHIDMQPFRRRYNDLIFGTNET